MATNNLTNEQDLVTRKFMTEVAGNKEYFPGDPATQQIVYAACVNLLGYVLINGKFISRKNYEGSTRSLHSTPDYTCEWEEDTRRVENAISKGKGERQTDSSQPTKGSPLWKAIFSKDV